MSAALSSAGRPWSTSARVSEPICLAPAKHTIVPPTPASLRPVDVRRQVDLALVAADERQRVAGARIGHRHAGICEPADRGRNARHDLEWDALLVQEQRFLATAVEHEWVAPLQPDDRPPFARLLSQEKTDRILIERLRRGWPDVDALRARARQSQQPPMNAMVVDDDVGGL